MSDKTRYAYAVGRIRAIEKRLLDKNKLDKMLDAKSPEDAVKVLVEAEYGTSSGDLASVFEYERLLNEETKKVFKLLNDIAPQPELFELFLLKNDYHNIKVLLKDEFLGQNNDNLLTSTGSISLTKLKYMLKERELADLPSIMRKAVDDSLDSFNRTRDPQVIDLILDKACFTQMIEVAKATENEFLLGLIVRMVDLANIKIFLRVKSLKKSWDFLQSILLPGGKIDKDVFIKNLQDSLDNFINALRSSAYGQLCEEGITDYISSGSLAKFENLSDNFIMSYVKKARYISFGIEPLIGYLVAKETEIKNARIIMIGKINNISNDIIRERLREAYV